MAALFDDNCESSSKITINKNYAAKYKKFKECQELDKLKQKYGENYQEDSSSSESEDEDAEGLTSQVEEDFLKTLRMIKSKDPLIYDKENTFFHEKTSNDQPDKKKGASKKPLLLKDFERQRLLERGEKAYLSDESDECDHLTYNDEQKQLKESFKLINNDDDDNDADDLLKIRSKTEKERGEEEEEYQAWLKKEGNGLNDNSEFSQGYWKGNEVDESEKFLRDYILKKQYIDGDSERIPTYTEVVGTLNSDEEQEDEEHIQEEEEFEKKYNFRFEEPNQELIKRYPRTIQASVRRDDDRRKMQRKEREERKIKEKEKKKQELKRLKKLKRKEIMEKIEKLKEITGNNKVGFLEEDMEADFDASKYDQLMSKVFDEKYYEDEEEAEKPVFSADEEFQDENWDEWTAGEVANSGLHFEDPEFNMDADYVPSKKTKNPKLREALQRKKPTFNPDEKTFEEYFDEYYKLDFEDIIGDMPVRFKYRSVTFNDYGLSTEEILQADDRELNQWCSLRKTMKYFTEDEEKKERQKYKKKSRDAKRKYRLLPSLNEDDGATDDANTVQRGKPCKQLKKNKEKVQFGNSLFVSKFAKSSRPMPPSATRIKKVQRQFKGATANSMQKLSLERLAAYGLDKRKSKNS